MPERGLSRVEEPGSLIFRLENSRPVALGDLAQCLSSLGESFDDFLISTDEKLKDDDVKFYVESLISGSIIARLQAIADQAAFAFDTINSVEPAKDVFERAKAVASFLVHFKELINFFLGIEKPEFIPTKKAAELISSIVNPVAKDNEGSLIVQIKGDVYAPIHINSVQANAIQNRARRFVGPTLPQSNIATDQILILQQIRGESGTHVGDRGIVEAITRKAVKIIFASDEIKKSILDSPENPFAKAFLVDIEIQTVDGRPVLYKIVALKETFDRK